MIKRVNDCDIQASERLFYTSKGPFNICPVAKLVTASDCYLQSQSEGREFEPHRGSFFFLALFNTIGHVLANQHHPFSYHHIPIVGKRPDSSSGVSNRISSYAAHLMNIL